MRILLTIHHRLDLDSGAPGTTLALAQAYRDAGHEATVVSYEDLPGNLPLLAQEVVFPEFVAWRLRRVAGEADVIDASTGDAWLWSYLTARSTRRPLLVTRSHGLEHTAHDARLAEAREGRLELSWKYPLYYGGFKLWEVKTSLRRGDLVFLLNEYDRNYAIERLGVDAHRIHVVPNAIAGSLLGQPAPEAPADGAPIRIAQVGSWIPRKGIRVAVPALSAVLDRHPDVAVSLLGTGFSADQVRADFPEHLRGRLSVVPRYRQDELGGLLSGHQIKLFPTLSEGFGKTLLEAMASGLAPITTNTPGPADIVTSGHDALVVRPGDAAEIEAALERLLADPELLQRIRLAAHETAQGYSWDAAARRRLDLYEQALNARVA